MAARNEVQNSASVVNADLTPFTQLLRQGEHAPAAARANLARAGAGDWTLLILMTEPSARYSMKAVAEAPMARARAVVMTANFMMGYLMSRKTADVERTGTRLSRSEHHRQVHALSLYGRSGLNPRLAGMNSRTFCSTLELNMRSLDSVNCLSRSGIAARSAES